MSKITFKKKETRINYKFTSQRMGPKMKSRQKEVKLIFFSHGIWTSQSLCQQYNNYVDPWNQLGEGEWLKTKEWAFSKCFEPYVTCIFLLFLFFTFFFILIWKKDISCIIPKYLSQLEVNRNGFLTFVWKFFSFTVKFKLFRPPVINFYTL